MSSILRALEKAKKEREELERRRAAGEDVSIPASPPDAKSDVRADTKSSEPAAKSRRGAVEKSNDALLPKSMPTQPSPYAATGYHAAPQPLAPAPQQTAAGGRDLRLFVGGLVLGIILIALIAIAAIAVAYAMMHKEGPQAVATPTPTVVVTPAPTQTPAPTPLLTPTPDPDAPPGSLRRGESGGLIIEDIRYADVATSGTTQQPRLRITPAPTPYSPQARTGDTPQLLNEPTPTPTPPPTPAPTLPAETTVLAEDFTAFKIDAILYSAARPVVMIRGRERYVGDTIEGHRIEKIVSDGVEFSYQGRTIRVRF